MDIMAVPARVAEMLTDLHYPAEKWEVIMCAEIRGADVDTRRRLYALPARTYESLREVIDSL